MCRRLGAYHKLHAKQPFGHDSQHVSRNENDRQCPEKRQYKSLPLPPVSLLVTLVATMWSRLLSFSISAVTDGCLLLVAHRARGCVFLASHVASPMLRWWALWDLNPRPCGYEPRALTN